MSAPKHMPTQSEPPTETACPIGPSNARSGADTSIHRAKLARFIAAAFSQPVFASGTDFDTPALAAELHASASALAIDSRLIDALIAAIDAGDANQDAFNRALGHTVRSDCSPYELEYRTAEVFQQSQTLADIAGFYRAFGMDITGPESERPDHVATQWEFLATISIKESLARTDEHLTCCLDAQRQFLVDHAAYWMPAFFSRIRRSHVGSFLSIVAELADAVLRQWACQLHISLGPSWLELRPVTDEDSTISCGTGGAVELGPILSAALDERQ